MMIACSQKMYILTEKKKKSNISSFSDLLLKVWKLLVLLANNKVYKFDYTF